MPYNFDMWVAMSVAAALTLIGLGVAIERMINDTTSRTNEKSGGTKDLD